MVQQAREREETKKRERSPEYPGLNLEEALKFAKVLYERERRNAAPINTVLKAWDYAPRSGLGLRAIAALQRFGLVVVEGNGDNRKARISEEAFKLLVDTRSDSPDRLRLLQAAALKPTAHMEMWDRYGKDLPSVDTLKYELRTRGFTEAGAEEFISEFTTTISFAELIVSDTLAPSEEDKTDAPPSGASDLMTQSQVLNPTKTIVTLPIAHDEWAALQAAFPMTEQKWSQMIAVLEAMKPALVDTSPPRKGPEPQAASETAESWSGN